MKVQMRGTLLTIWSGAPFATSAWTADLSFSLHHVLVKHVPTRSWEQLSTSVRPLHSVRDWHYNIKHTYTKSAVWYALVIYQLHCLGFSGTELSGRFRYELVPLGCRHSGLRRI